jgi:MSHA pilin protein MshC
MHVSTQPAPTGAPRRPGRAVDTPFRRRPRASQCGFTLVELVVVISILAIVSAIGVAGRFVDRSAFDARAFAPQLSQYLAAGQRIAVAQRRAVFVDVDTAAGRVRLCLDSGCTQPVPASPALSSNDPAWLQVPANLRLASGAASFSFAADGTPSFASTASLRLTDAAGNDLDAGASVEAGSGHVRAF